MRMLHSAGLAGAVALVMAMAGPAVAGDRRDADQDRARAAVQAGVVMPLPALLERVQRTYPGQVLRVELEQDDGRWTYELRLLQPDGRLLKLEVDARSGEVLESKSPRERRRPPPGPAPS